MESLQKESFKAFYWDFSGKIAGQLVAFIVSIFLARLLSPADFGLLAIVNVIIAFSNIFLDLGLSVSLVQNANIREEHYGSVFWFNLATGILFTLLLFFTAGPLAVFYENTEIKDITRLMSLLFLINAFGRVISAKLHKEMKFDVPVKAQLGAAFFSGVLGVAMAFAGFGVWSLVAQSLLFAVLSNLLLYLLEKWRPKLYFSWKALKELWGFGFRMFLSGVLNALYTNLDALIIGKLFPAAVLGQYYRAKSTSNIIVNNASGSLMAVFLPALSSVQNDLERVRQIVSKSFHFICLISFFLTGFFYVIGGDCIIILFSDKWMPAVPLFELTMLSAYAYPVSAVLVNVIVAMGNSKAFLRLEIYKKVLLSLNFIIGFYFGIEEFLIGFIIVNLLSVLLNIWYAADDMKVPSKWFISRSAIYILSTFAITVTCKFAFMFFETNYVLHLLLCGSAFCLLFLAAMLLFRSQGMRYVLEQLKWKNIGSRIIQRFYDR